MDQPMSKGTPWTGQYAHGNELNASIHNVRPRKLRNPMLWAFGIADLTK
jgi:hypothetical protein